jgi:hypothetical protein
VTAGPTTSAPAARPCAAPAAERERAGARHRGLLQHRRADVQGDPLGAVASSRRRQDVPKKDIATAQAIAYGNVYVARSRWAPIHSRPGGVPRGGGLRRAVAGARLQPLHRARHRDAHRARPAVPRRRQRILAADPL